MTTPVTAAGSRHSPAPAETPARWILTIGAVGLALYALFNLVIFVLVYINPEARSVVPVYRIGSLGWWAGQDIFGEGTAGFIYLPSFAVLYTPFALLGPQFGDIAWRAVSAALLAYSIAEVFRVVLPRFDARTRWLIVGTALLIALPGAANSLRNGQATNILYGLMLLATVHVIERRWWSGAILLGLAFALKPLAIVYILLVAALQPKIIPKLIVALIVLMILPLINPNPARALELYGLGIHKVLASGAPEAGRWSDITGLLGRFGIIAPESLLTAARVVTALLTLALGFIALRRNGLVRGMINLYALSIVYLMLMSPRTEAQTYLMLSSTLAIGSVIGWHVDGERKVPTLFIILAVALAAGGLGTAMLRATDLWWDPLLCLIYLPFLVRDCLTVRPGEPSADVGR